MWVEVILSLVLTASLSVDVTEASSVLLVKKNVISQVDRAWRELKAINRTGKTQEELLRAVGRRIGGIPAEISKVEREIILYEYDKTLKSLSRVKNTSTTWREKWNKIAALSSPVDIIYGHFKIFPDMPDAFIPGSGAIAVDANTLVDLILKSLYKTDIDSRSALTLEYIVDNVHNVAVQRSSGKNVFTLLANHIEEALQQSNWCLWSGKSAQRIVYGMYAAISILDIREYTLLNFGWMLRYALNGTDPGDIMDECKAQFEKRFDEKASYAMKAIGKASSSYWRCDPITHQRGKTYEEFQELLQGYIENEKNLHHRGSCRQTCEDYDIVKVNCSYPDPASCHHHRLCTGSLVDCKFVAADSTVCPADPPRRFDYIQYKKGPAYGNSAVKCAKETERRDSFWRFLYHCSNCFCLCDDPSSPTTIRHVSLASSESDVFSNKIVSGVKFAMKDKVLHLQMEEGVATTEGLVVDTSTVWKPVPKVSKKNGSETVMLEYTLRALDLDDLMVPLNHVVTGVRFRRLGDHINLEVQATQINPETGKLMPQTRHWISNDNTPEAFSGAPRKELVLKDPDNPTRTRSPSVPDSTHDQFVSFGASSAEKDVAQSTVPFIDIQEVRPNKPAVWLRGIGIFHKGQNGFGGFVAPRIFTHSPAEYIQY